MQRENKPKRLMGKAMHVNDLFSLSKKTAIITGGSVGLGAQMAIALAEAGANTVIAARKIDRCIEMCNKLENTGVKSVPVACDVSRIEDCRNLTDSIIKEFGTIDILVNNAGISWIADSLEYPMDKWQKVLNLNITGTFQLSVIAAKTMKEKGGGKIINISSIGGFRGDYPENVDSVAYTASKGAVLTMTKDLAVKWAKYNINVNAICPGYFPTSLNREHLNKSSDRLLPRIPLGRYGKPDDLKGLIVFLSSSASDYITGQYIVVDGGQTALA
jgi:NAD(P)-dependent dehydrogenase (short-subunit alcohol dehydrogenase family)